MSRKRNRRGRRCSIRIGRSRNRRKRCSRGSSGR